jgi:altronate dehydratase large subunit
MMSASATFSADCPDTMISGYRRAGAIIGVRNHVLVLGINGLALRVSERIAKAVPGTICVATPSGRGLVEPDLGLHLNQLVGLGRNGNVAAVLVVGVDAETTAFVADRIAEAGKPVESVSFAEGGEDMLAVLDQGVRRLAHLVRQASRCRREPIPFRDLIVGVECGHSDATSGIASNPVVGATVDRLVNCGATVIVGETVEWLGAEHLLARRARDSDLGAKIVQAAEAREAMAAASGQSLTGNNPGEENIRGGLSTIEEKSLGAIAKSGSRPIDGLLGIAERPPARGLYLMDGPSFSPESMTGFAAAGAQMMMFTTGPGNSFVSQLAPTVKVTAQAETAQRLREQIDFDASAVLAGEETAAEAAQRLVVHLLDVAEGTLTWGEVLAEGLEVPARIRGSL